LNFEAELNQILPFDLPHREIVATQAAEHLSLIEEMNRHFNLTRITGIREAAIKHVIDSVMPWRLFSGARSVLDAGTGAGFPGVPLALVLPDVHFTLAESIQKKARFVESAVAALGLRNVKVEPRRAEEIIRGRRIDIITARAVMPITRALGMFATALLPGVKLLLYKGPDVEQEMADASSEARKNRVRMDVVMSYELPEAQGSRTVVEIERVR
jgi:16S rRNA (guanine527-N7)-methyltransferase